MRFYIGSDSGSGQTFSNKEAFLKELSLMIDDCETNGGSQFDVTVDADASCFDPDIVEEIDIDVTYHDCSADDLREMGVLGASDDDFAFTDTILMKREQCVHGTQGEDDSDFFCKYLNRSVTGCDCYNCNCWLDEVKGE